MYLHSENARSLARNLRFGIARSKLDSLTMSSFIQTQTSGNAKYK